MVGQTTPIGRHERQRFTTIKEFCGCLCCLLMGYLDVHTSIEHLTESGRRIGRGAKQHKCSIGLCNFHHFGTCNHGWSSQRMIGEYGPSLAYGRRSFEEFFGDELQVLLLVQDYLLEQFADEPWPEYNLPGKVARRTRTKWINLNHANAQSPSILGLRSD